MEDLGVKLRLGIGFIAIGGAAFIGGYLVGNHKIEFSTYEECIQTQMPKTQNMIASRAIMDTCSTLYKKSNPFDKFDKK